jgi:hypothetical protein
MKTLILDSSTITDPIGQRVASILKSQLQSNRVRTSTIYLYPTLNSPRAIQSFLEAIDANDLIVLASPLYMDSLPGLVTHSLELITEHRAGKEGLQAFSAVINSGFPEARQSETALAICATFARQAKFHWAGGVALGGGAGVVNGTPLINLGWRARSVREALELAAASLAEGNPVPEEAVSLMGKTRIPNWLMILASSIGWRQRAKKYGAQKLLRQQL